MAWIELISANKPVWVNLEEISSIRFSDQSPTPIAEIYPANGGSIEVTRPDLVRVLRAYVEGQKLK